MRLSSAIALVFVFPVIVPAQDVPDGADRETVIRAYGAPRSRSAARGREIWMYPEFKVVFEEGRMISHSGRPLNGGAAVEWQKPIPPAAAVPPQASVSRPAAVATRSSPSATPPRAAGATVALPDPGRKITATVESGKIVMRSAAHAVPPPPSKSGFGATVARLFWMLLGSSIAAAALFWVARRKWREWRAGISKYRTGEMSTQGRSDPSRENAVACAVGKPPSLSEWEIPLDMLRSIEWKRFEQLVERFYQASGFRTLGAGAGADDGANLFLFRPNAKRAFSCVQCKAWGEPTVELPLVRELFDEMAARELAEGVIITTGNFDAEAVAFAAQNRITLISGEAFIARFNRLAPMVRERILREITEGDYTTPTCPRCNAKLELRSNAEGSSSWGCRRYPICRYTKAPTLQSAGSGAGR